MLTGIAIASVVNAHAEDLNTSIVADNQEDTYQRCLVAAETKPEAAMDMALRWGRLNGADPAQHCLAVAMMNVGDSEAAAPLLESLAQSSSATAPVRVGLLRQTAQAWMAIAEYKRAVTALEQALILAKNDSTLLMDMAVAHAALEDYWSAIDDLNTVLDQDPRMTEALVLRGSAYRRLGFPELSKDDLQRALEFDSANLDALLELGLLARDGGDKISARRHWFQVLETAPSSATADAVRSHLEVMDVVVEP